MESRITIQSVPGLDSLDGLARREMSATRVQVIERAIQSGMKQQDPYMLSFAADMKPLGEQSWPHHRRAMVDMSISQIPHRAPDATLNVRLVQLSPKVSQLVIITESFLLMPCTSRNRSTLPRASTFRRVQAAKNALISQRLAPRLILDATQDDALEIDPGLLCFGVIAYHSSIQAPDKLAHMTLQIPNADYNGRLLTIDLLAHARQSAIVVPAEEVTSPEIELREDIDMGDEANQAN